MNCRTCDYPLWNLRTQCPECGTPFKPSDFEFTANKVEFCCPHCEQPYYGTDARGHLVPAAFTCVTCNRPMTMDETTVRLAPGVPESATRRERMPWLERGDRSAIKALFATIGESLVQPGRLMRAVPEASPLGPAWKFAVVTNALTMVVRMLPALCVMAGMPFIASAGGGAGGTNAPMPGVAIGLFGGMMGAGFAIAMLTLVVSLFVWPAVCHGVLVITGGAAAGMRRTAQAILYSSGANASSAIPCIGNLGGIWWIVSAVLMVRAGQRVHGGRATLAVITYPLLLFLVFGAAYALFIMAMIAGVSGGGGFVGTVATGAARTAETATMVFEITSYAADHDGLAPPHAAAIVSEHGTATGNFIATGTNTSHQAVTVGGVTLSQLQREGVPAQRATAERAAAKLPPGVVAHRLGDFVFTYHGIDLSGDTSGLWIVVLAPDPDLNPGPQDALATGVNGVVTRIPAGMMTRRLAEQNAIRAARGLPPLADPTTVTHDQPAVAERRGP